MASGGSGGGGVRKQGARHNSGGHTHGQAGWRCGRVWEPQPLLLLVNIIQL